MSLPRIAVLPGDGIGPEVIAVALRVAEAAGFQAQWEHHPIGWNQWCENGDPLPEATLAACEQADAVLLGAVTSKSDDLAEQELRPSLQNKGLRYRSPILRLRQQLDLFANVRGVQGGPLDMTIFRENTEGLYAGYEARPVPVGLQEIFPGLPTGEDSAVSLRLVTRRAIERVSHAAFRHARAHTSNRVTLIEKPNVLRETGGLVREAFYRVAEEYPGIEADELNVDAACALLVREPRRFEVVVATNLFGDIISDLAAELGGGLSLAASANLGDRHALFEPVHGSAPSIAGQGKANPIGAVRTLAMMAEHLGALEEARRITTAVDAVVADTGLRSIDQGGHADTALIEAALIARLEETVPAR